MTGPCVAVPFYLAAVPRWVWEATILTSIAIAILIWEDAR